MRSVVGMTIAVNAGGELVLREASFTFYGLRAVRAIGPPVEALDSRSQGA